MGYLFAKLTKIIQPSHTNLLLQVNLPLKILIDGYLIHSLPFIYIVHFGVNISLCSLVEGIFELLSLEWPRDGVGGYLFFR